MGELREHPRLQHRRLDHQHRHDRYHVPLDLRHHRLARGAGVSAGILRTVSSQPLAERGSPNSIESQSVDLASHRESQRRRAKALTTLRLRARKSSLESVSCLVSRYPILLYRKFATVGAPIAYASLTPTLPPSKKSESHRSSKICK